MAFIVGFVVRHIVESSVKLFYQTAERWRYFGFHISRALRIDRFSGDLLAASRMRLSLMVVYREFR